MKISIWMLMVGLTVSAGWSSASAGQGGPVTRRGTSVLHYMTRNDLVSTEEGSNVVGELRLQFNEQGHSQKQSVRLRAVGLEPDATYGLITVNRNDTNTVLLVTNVDADAKGRLRLDYMSKAQGRGGKNPLPDLLNPLTDVHSIGLENSATQTVAYAHPADSDKFQYIVKRNLTAEDTNGTAAGSISLIANQRRVNFRLLAGGLSATNDYHFSLNSNIVSTVQTDANGRVLIKTWPVDAPPVLELHSMQLLDGTSNVVLHTSLPQ